MGAIGLFLSKFWREGIILLLIVAMYFGAVAFGNKIDDVNDQLNAANKNLGALTERTDRLVQVNDEYKTIFRTISEISQVLKKNTEISQVIVNKLDTQRQSVMIEYAQQNLKALTCEQKFDWLIDRSKVPLPPIESSKEITK